MPSPVPITAPTWKAKPHRRKYELARQEIIDAAAKVLETKSTQQLRLEDVAREAGCVRSRLYRYFDSKDDLLKAVLASWMHEAFEEVVKQTQHIPDFSQQLCEAFYFCYKQMQEGQRFQSVLQVENRQYLIELMMDFTSREIAALLETVYVDEQGKPAIREDISYQEAAQWMIMQILALDTLPSIGETPEAEKEFIRKLIAPVLFTPPHF